MELGEGGALESLALIAISEGDFAAARAPLAKVLGPMGLDEQAVGVLNGLADASRRPVALALLDGVSTGIQERRFSLFNVGFVLDLYHTLGDLDGLFALANAMSDQGYATIEDVFWGQKYRDLRRDPRFEELVRKRGLLDFWREHGWPDGCSAAGDGLRCD